MTNSGASSIAMRRPAAESAGRRNNALAASPRSQAVRMNLFVLVRILFQYLERVDKSICDLAKMVLKDCERKHNTKDSKYNTLADAIAERVRDCVGESHWIQARKIQKQLAANQQKKRLKAMAKRAVAAQSRKGGLEGKNQYPGQVSRRFSNDKAMEAAKTISIMSQHQAPFSSQQQTPFFSSSSSAALSPDQEMNDNRIPMASSRINQEANVMARSSPREAGAYAAAATSGHVPLKKRVMTFDADPNLSSKPWFATS